MLDLSRARTRALLGLTTLALGASLAGLTTGPGAASAAGPVTINLLGINDFHGRIDPGTTVKWGYEIEHLRDQATTPSDGSLLLGAGDLIGASLFTSAIADDQPTIDVLNEVGLDASSVGNHEFDKGWADLRDRVIGGDPAHPSNAGWDYLGANVYAKGTTDPVLPSYETFDVSGVTVGVVGAVTQETSSLVSPGGISDLDFGPVVPAINRVAGELSDGNPDNGEADVIVAVVHAGAVDGTKGYDQEVAQGGEFADMAEHLSPEVNVAFQGHTHQAYVYDAPVTGGDTATRPMLQTGSYGSNIGQVVLTVDPATGHVIGYTAANNAVPTSGDNATYIAQYPDVLQPVDDTVTAAKAHADEIGNQPVGSVTADITTAFKGGSYVDGRYAGGTRDDRASESTLGDLVANALRDGLPADMGHADLGITNPGGLRNELYYAGDTSTSPANTDGVVTYAEANNVLPFVNNIWTVNLKGRDLEQVLEQQWQPSGASRPYLNLGLSDNVQVTLDPTRPEGQRVTSVLVDGRPLDPDKTYTVCTFSFLGTGGDNFTAFTHGTSHDTGLVDRDLWIGYLKHHPDLGPDFARQEVVESGMPHYVAGGQQVAFTLGQLDLTSLGSPANTSVTAYATTPSGRESLGTFPVTDGAASLDLTVPADVPANSPLTVVASPSGTTVGKSESPTHLSATADDVRYGHRAHVLVDVDPSDATGTVTVWKGSEQLGSAPVQDGTADVTLPTASLGLRPARYGLTVSYSGDSTHTAASTSVDLRVTKAHPKMSADVQPEIIKAGKTRPKVEVSLTSLAHGVTGKVAVHAGGHSYLTRLDQGVATVALGVFRHSGDKTVRVAYLGSDTDASVTKTVTVHVRR